MRIINFHKFCNIERKMKDTLDLSLSFFLQEI